MQVPMVPKFCEAGLCGYFPQMPYSYNSIEDARLKAEWANQYYQASIAYNDAVVSALRAMGFTVDVIGNACVPAAGCYGLALYGAVMKKDNRQMDTNIGFGTRFDSPQQEAEYLARIFEQNASTSATEWQQQAGTAVYVETPKSESHPLSVRMNVPAGGFSIGQQEWVEVSGPPNSPVYSKNWVNGVYTGDSKNLNLRTDSYGIYKALYTFLPGMEGDHKQEWYVNGQYAGSVSYTVKGGSAPQYTYAGTISAPEGFFEGKPYEIVIHGAPNSLVRVRSMHNSKDLLYSDRGKTDSQGVFVEKGVFEPGTAGKWNQVWYVGDQIANQFLFTVYATSSNSNTGASSSSGSGRPLSASIHAPDGYVTGRSWTVTVTGPALEPVSVQAYQNGKDLGRTQYGKTNSEGVFSMTGTFTAGTEGGWTQYWYVGDSLAGVVNFMVSPAAAAPQPGETFIQDSPAPDVLSKSPDGGDQREGVEVETGGIRVAVGGIPSWIWIAAAAAGGYLLMNSGGKK